MRPSRYQFCTRIQSRKHSKAASGLSLRQISSQDQSLLFGPLSDNSCVREQDHTSGYRATLILSEMDTIPNVRNENRFGWVRWFAQSCTLLRKSRAGIGAQVSGVPAVLLVPAPGLGLGRGMVFLQSMWKETHWVKGYRKPVTASSWLQVYALLCSSRAELLADSLMCKCPGHPAFAHAVLSGMPVAPPTRLKDHCWALLYAR